PMILDAADALVDEIQKSEINARLDIAIERKNAQNEFTMAQSIAQDVVRLKYDYLVTLTTPVLQVCAQVNKTIPHIFGAVTDPYRMGVAKTPEDHIPNITGVATFQPVESTFVVMRELFPQAKRVGIVWNPAEACSEACTQKARIAAQELGFELLEVTVTSTTEVMDGVRNLAGKGIDLFLTSGDNTVNLALASVAKYLQEHKIPYFTNTFSDVEQGAFVSVGADYTEVGRETARMAIRVMGGEEPSQLPINNYVPEKIYLNLALAKAYGLAIPESFIQKAAKVKE
ncbi:MAG: ABC transporter substrate-binding protein, partial [bacterium]|nr:ABC transporter substrate-binding protein [bacterium]